MDKDRKPGGVKQVISGNCLLLTGPVNKETGLPMTKFMNLQGIQTPEYFLGDKENPKQESYGFRAREFLRKKVLGLQVEFTIEHKIKDSNEKVVGTVYYNGEDLAEQLLLEGLAETRPGKHPNQEKYEEAQNKAKQNKQGRWSGKENNLQFQKFEVKDIAVQGKKYLNCLVLDAQVEDVVGLFVFYAYVPELQSLVKCAFGEIFVPQVSQVLSNRIKWSLQDLLMQQEVTLEFLGFEEKFAAVRVDVHKGNTDVKKELLSLGFYKLGSNAFQVVGNQQRFNELRDAQNQAELKQLGLWKESTRAPQTQGGNVSVNRGAQKVFYGRLLEAHSGDSVTVLNDVTKEILRVYLASIRAPQYTQKEMKPWGFEAREYIRKTAVGRQVKVAVEFEKTIAPKQHEGLSDDEDSKKRGDIKMTFADILLLDEESKSEQNLSTLIVQAGLAQVQPPKGDDGFSKFLEDLKNAQEQATKTKKGMHGKANQGLPKFNDLSLPHSAQKAKSAYQFLKDEKRVTGVVELVLNGTRYKVRFHEQNCYGLFLLAGVKGLPNDQNFPEYQKFSNLALQYAKQNILQRDVEIELDSIDKKGVFHGHLLLGKQLQNFGLRLLEQGLVVTFNPVQTQHKYHVLYEDAEERARQRGDGLWSIKGLDLAVVRGVEEEYQLTTMRSLGSEIRKLVAVEIVDSNTLYFQDPTSKTLDKVEQALGKFAADDNNKLLPPLKKGLQCVAKFSADDRWYRARVTKEFQKQGKDPKYEVIFLDYGNSDIVSLVDLRKSPENVVGLPFQAIRSSLAYLKGPSCNHQLGDQVGEFIRDQIFEKELTVQMEHTDDVSQFMVVYLTKEKLPERTLNFLLLQKGYARVDKKQPPLPAAFAKWQQAEDQAIEERKGVWNYDDEDEDQE